jgi:NTP pyrophosphatase (non-canonical NTP hydrolase)
MDDAQTTHFNELTEAEAERLAMLAEEAAEVIQEVGKILRHGYESCHPTELPRRTNRERLHKELTELFAVATSMGQEDIADISPSDVQKAWQRKLQYTHHQ